MRRWTSLLLCGAMIAGLAVPALAEVVSLGEDKVLEAPDTDPIQSADGQSADARLARVTERVKNTLDMDTEMYADFEGYVSEEELGTVWNLNWSGSDLYLNIQALEDGTVVGYWLNDNTDMYAYRAVSGLPTFPKVDTAKAKAAASDFLKKVLNGATETVELEDPTNVNSLGRTNTTFNGRIKLNGLDSPLSYYITVRGSDNAVTSFRRDAPSTSFLGNIPSPNPAVSQADAAASLKTTLNLELRYVTSEDDADKAVLRYVPKDQQDKYVDAQTGALVEPSNYRIYYANGAPAEEAEMSMMDAGSAAARGLTQVELEGVEKMTGVLLKETLDRRVRAESAYMLDGFTFSSARYRLVKAEDSPTGEESVFCTLSYVKADTEDGEAQERVVYQYRETRTFTVNARTGEVYSLYGSGRWDDKRVPAVPQERARGIASDFLNRFFAHASEMSLYDSTDNTKDGAPSYAFTFARKANDYFSPENAFTVEIDCTTGAVCGLNYTYNEKISFDAPTGLISSDAALDAWMNTYRVELAYRYLSKELDAAGSETEARLINVGYTSFYSLLLTYALEREKYVSGIDARTAAPVETVETSGEITYTDVAGSSAEAEILRLAAFRVGYTGGVFRPEKQLTQWDMVCLIVSTQGYRIDPDNATDDEKNNAYSAAYRMGVLTRDERNDTAALNRGALVKLLLNSAGYGGIAKLNGIFTCNYTDKSSIAAEDTGYAALAEGLGMVSGTYNAAGNADRALAAVLLCRLMERDV